MSTCNMSQEELEVLLRRYDWTVVWFGLVGLIVVIICSLSSTTWQPTISGERWTKLQPDKITFQGDTITQFILPISAYPDISMHPRSEVGVIDCLKAGQQVGYYWYYMPGDTQARVWNVCPSYPHVATICPTMSDNADSYVVRDECDAGWVDVSPPPYKPWPISLYFNWQCTSGKGPADGQWVNLAPWVVIDQSFST